MNKNKINLIELWDKVAHNFGKSGPKYWDRFGERLIELSDIKEGDYVLDFGMGRGASLFPVAKKIGSRGIVIGIDISEIMVRKTNEEIAKENIKNAKVIYMDVDELKFPDEYFHSIVAGFSIGYILGNDTSLKNLLRTLKNNGQLAFSLWGVQQDQKWLTDIVEEYLLPNNGKENQSKEEGTEFNTVNGVKRFLEDLNLKEIKVYEENNEVIYLDKNQWWNEMWNNAVRGIFESIQNLGECNFNEFQGKVNKALQNYEGEKGLYFNMKVIYAYGKK